jgi:hypothetical protein
VAGAPLDAEALLALPPRVRARRELGPLLYGVLAAEDRLGALDRDTQAAARRAYLGTVARNQRLCGRVAEILDRAETAGLELLPYKGVVLAERYGDIGLRPMVDVDLLAHPAQIGAAERLLVELGFRRSYGAARRFSPRHAHDVSFTDEQEPDLVLELHYRLFHELGVSAEVEPLFQRAGEGPWFGRRCRLPSWDDHLMAAAIHAATHAFEQVMWPFDLLVLLREGGRPEAALAEAERRSGGVPFRAALRVAERLFPGRVPPPPARPSDRLRELLLERLLGAPMTRAPGRVRSLVARAILTERPGDAVRAVVRKLGLRLEEAAEWATARPRGGNPG